MQAGVGKHPGIVDCSGAMFGQVLLSQVAGEADDPGVLALSNMGKHPDVGGAHHVKLMTDGRGAPLCKGLKINPAGTVQQVCLQRKETRQVKS